MDKTKKSKWQFWVDRGGTFTDIVACTPDGTLKTGFVAQIVLKTFLPLPQTDSAYGFCLGYAKSGEAI
jgi:hypothetical protein